MEFMAEIRLNGYVTALPSLRHDLSTTIVRFMAELTNYTEDGVNILIDNGWLEEPPQAVHPDSLKKKMH
jgi:hypothetical protein